MVKNKHFILALENNRTTLWGIKLKILLLLVLVLKWSHIHRHVKTVLLSMYLRNKVQTILFFTTPYFSNGKSFSIFIHLHLFTVSTLLWYICMYMDTKTPTILWLETRAPTEPREISFITCFWNTGHHSALDYKDFNSKCIYLFIYCRLIAPSTAQGHLRAFH